MSENKINPNELSTAVIGTLENWTADIQNGVVALTDEKAKRLKSLISAASPKRSRKYAKSWRVKVTHNSFSYYEKTVHSGKHYSLTHLLEKPHVKRNHRGSVNPQVHIRPAAETVQAEYLDGIKKIIQTSQSAGGGRRSYKK